MALEARSIKVPHLDTTVVYRHARSNGSSQKPTLVLVHSFMTSSLLYEDQLTSQALLDTTDLVAFDLLAHGDTRTPYEHYTYWDYAMVIVQALEKLGIDKYYALGTSQGGWIVVRMALLEPKKVLGIIPLGTSMDYESQRTRDLGCWDVHPMGGALISGWTSKEPTPSFALDDDYCETLMDLGIGKDADKSVRNRLIAETKRNYTGDDGRARARMACINLRDRDGLHGRIADVRCPVLWMHGTADTVYSVDNAQEEIKMFTNSIDARVSVVEGGSHFLSASNPKEVEPAVIEFLKVHG